MNAKLAKLLRRNAKYKNQTSTPGVCPFPGVAKNLLEIPVFETRPSFHSTYERRDGKFVRVIHRRTAMAVVGRIGREEIVRPEMEVKTVKEGRFAGSTYMGPRTTLVARPLPARLGDGPKADYRKLKRIFNLGLAQRLAEFIAHTEDSSDGKQVPAI